MTRVPVQLDDYSGSDLPTGEIARFQVLYGKTSTRKHKIWEGDGILILYSDCCLLKSDDEKDVICRSGSVKRVDDLEDGRIIVLGSWSVEIQERIVTTSKPSTIQNTIKVETPPMNSEILTETRKRALPTISKLQSPIASKKGFLNPMLGMSGEPEQKVPVFCLNEQDVLKRKASPICVDQRFVKFLRPHQKDGIRFIFEKLKNENSGAILADDMGLGKSIQTMAATWSFMRGAKNNVNIASKCLIVVPSSLVNNWKAEFNKWWRNMRFPLASLEIQRRLILTGTPMQNDFEELYSLLDFIRPESFGTCAKFLKLCSEEPQKLNEMIDECMLRRTAEVNQSHLPEKHEYIFFCRASEAQKKIHEEICDYMTGDALSLIFYARQLSNHPKLMYDNLLEKHEKGNKKHSSLLAHFSGKLMPTGGVKESGKLSVLLDMLKCFRLLNECAVIVSNFIETLDMIEQLCNYLEFKVFRLDGKVAVQDRQKLVKQFNEVHDAQNVFLLSTKAGGVGLNLIGASRLVLFDSDWNPANDQQAMARIWRDGQVRPCHIYRLVTTGTIEEKMLQRQIKKTGLGSVIDAIEVGETVSTFSDEELQAIFTFTPDTECNTHDLCECKCDGTGMFESEMVSDDENEDENDSDDMTSYDDEQLEENEDDEVVADSQESVVVGAESVKEDVKDEEARASLAELSRWRHFSPRHDDTWKHLMTNCGMTSTKNDDELTFAFYLTSQF